MRFSAARRSLWLAALLVCPCILPAAEPLNPQIAPWRMIEAGGGGAYFAVGVGPTGIALVAADLSGGYVSYDNGKSWHNRGAAEGIVFGTHGCAVGFDPADENQLYLGTLGVLYKSTDRGATFQPLLSSDWNEKTGTGTFAVVREARALERFKSAPLKHRRLYWTAIAFSSSDPRIGYATAHADYNSLDAFVLKTTDRGETWSVVAALSGEAVRIQKILVDPREPSTAYFLSQADGFTSEARPASTPPPAHVRKSTDGGLTWKPLGHGPEADLRSHVLDFELDPADSKILYATKGARHARTKIPGTGTYKSTDAGATWSNVDGKFGALKVKAVDGDAARTIVRRFDINGWEGSALPKDRKYPQVWESPDAGRTWHLKADKDKFSFGPIDPHWYSSASAYTKTIAGSSLNPDVYFWVDSQWVYTSDDGGASFHSATTRATHGSDGGMWYSSTGVSNVVSLTLKISEADPNLIFQGNCDIGLWRSLDRGQTWQHANEPGYLSDWVRYGGQAHTLALDPERPNVVWAGLGAAYVDEVMVKSSDFGKLGSWQRSHRGLPLEKRRATYQEGAVLRGLSVDRTSPKDNRTLFVIADDKVARSTDDGAIWTEVFDPTEGRPFNYNGLKGGNTSPDRQGATTVDPTDGRFVYAGGVHGLYRSTRGGAPGTWERIKHAGLEKIQKIIVSRQNPAHVYVAAYGSGLFLSKDRGVTWSRILDDRFLRGFALHPHHDRIILAGSCNVFKSGGQPESRGALLSTDAGATWREVNDGLSWPFVRDVEFDPKDPSQVFIVTPGTSFHIGRFRFEL